MLVEMVSFSLSVFSGLSTLLGLSVNDPPPPPTLQSPIPIESRLAVNTETIPIEVPTLTPTNTPIPTATSTPTPAKSQPTATPIPPTYTPTPTLPPPTPTPIPATATSLEDYFSKYSGEYSVDKEVLKRIANCESGFNAGATNGPYGGMFQYAESSWQAIRSRMGMDTNADLRFNPEESIKTAAFHISTSGAAAWPSC